MSIHTSPWPLYNPKLIREEAELAGEVGIDVINTVRKYKSEQQVSMKQELAELMLISEEKEFKKTIEGIERDLKAVLNVKKISFAGETAWESERFKVRIGIRK